MKIKKYFLCKPLLVKAKNQRKLILGSVGRNKINDFHEVVDSWPPN